MNKDSLYPLLAGAIVAGILVFLLSNDETEVPDLEVTPTILQQEKPKAIKVKPQKKRSKPKSAPLKKTAPELPQERNVLAPPREHHIRSIEDLPPGSLKDDLLTLTRKAKQNAITQIQAEDYTIERLKIGDIHTRQDGTIYEGEKEVEID